MVADSRRGFALVFVVVTLAVLLILATAVLTHSVTRDQRQRISTAASALRRLQAEIGSTATTPSYYADVSEYPLRLSYLYAKITRSDSNACGTKNVNSDSTAWAGPYHLTPMIRDSTYQLQPGIVLEDRLLRTPTSGNNNQPAVLSLIMNAVAITDAQDLGLAFDGLSTGAGPIITFTPSGNTPVLVHYNINIVGC